MKGPYFLKKYLNICKRSVLVGCSRKQYKMKKAQNYKYCRLRWAEAILKESELIKRYISIKEARKCICDNTFTGYDASVVISQIL